MHGLGAPLGKNRPSLKMISLYISDIYSTNEGKKNYADRF